MSNKNEVLEETFADHAFAGHTFASLEVPVNPGGQINVASILVSGGQTTEGMLVEATTAVWELIVSSLGDDWSKALQYSDRQWEAIIAGAFKKLGFSKVTLTPRSGDHGRDVIAVQAGFLSHKVVVSVKANAPGNLVTYDDVRALLHVMNAERDVTKAMLTTTSDFPPKLKDDPLIAPYLPTRLELLNGDGLRLLLKDVQPSANS